MAIALALRRVRSVFCFSSFELVLMVLRRVVFFAAVI